MEVRNHKFPVGEENYLKEEWERMSVEIDPDADKQQVGVQIHKVQARERVEMCFHTFHEIHDTETKEAVRIAEILRQRWDTGGYNLRPVSMNRLVYKADLRDFEDPTIGRLP